MKIDITSDNDTISVKIELKKINRKKNTSTFKFLKRDVLKILKKGNIEVGEVISDPGVITNTMGEKQLSGEWIFEKPKKPVKNTRKPKKVKKTLDKSPKDVIIKVQEKILSSKED